MRRVVVLFHALKGFFVTNNLGYCGELVRTHDYDRFLLSMFLKADIREDVWAILAYNHEISKTREVVSESTLGLVRLQWWRDAVKGIYEEGTVLEHEVLKPLASAIKRHDLPREAFDKLAYAREFDLEDVLPGNIEGLLNYADFTTTPLFELIIKITGDNPAQHIIQPVAMNYALAGLLRSVKAHAKHHRVYLPEDIMQNHAVTRESLFESDGLKDVIKDIAEARLEKTKPAHIFLKGAEALSETYFKHMARHHYDVMSPQCIADPAFKVLRVFCKTKIL